MAKRFQSVKSGEWVQPVRRGYKMACCDCGLVHTLNFRLVKNGRGAFIQFQAFRDEKATKLVRKRDKHNEA
jgi:hypothetical protein